MATDPVTKQLQSIDAHLSGIGNSLKEISKTLKAMNNNYVTVNRRPQDVVTKDRSDGDGTAGDRDSQAEVHGAGTPADDAGGTGTGDAEGSGGDAPD